MRLRREDGGFLRIGHRGAATLAAENSLAAIEAALDAGVDGVELDVIRGPGGELVVAHSRRDRTAASPTLDEALGLLAGTGVLIDLDLKRPGFEVEAAAALRRHGVIERALVSSYFAGTLRAVRRLEPGLATGAAYQFDRTGHAERVAPARVVRAALGVMRGALPRRIGRMLRAAEADVAVLHHLVLSRPLLARCRALRVPVFAWTVNDPAALQRVLDLGVDGVISDDPRIFPAAEAGRGNKSGSSPV